MAYFTQEMKKARTPAIKKICNEYGVKVTFGVKHHSTFVINISSGDIDFFGDMVDRGDKQQVASRQYMQVNPYWFREHFEGKSKEFLQKVFSEANKGNHNNSDIQTDYFDVGYYVDLNIGKWDKPYVCTK